MAAKHQTHLDRFELFVPLLLSHAISFQLGWHFGICKPNRTDPISREWVNKKEDAFFPHFVIMNSDGNLVWSFYSCNFFYIYSFISARNQKGQSATEEKASNMLRIFVFLLLLFFFSWNDKIGFGSNMFGGVSLMFPRRYIDETGSMLIVHFNRITCWSHQINNQRKRKKKPFSNDLAALPFITKREKEMKKRKFANILAQNSDCGAFCCFFSLIFK